MDNSDIYKSFYGQEHTGLLLLYPINYEFINGTLFPVSFNVVIDGGQIKKVLEYFGFAQLDAYIQRDIVGFEKAKREIDIVIVNMYEKISKHLINNDSCIDVINSSIHELNCITNSLFSASKEFRLSDNNKNFIPLDKLNQENLITDYTYLYNKVTEVSIQNEKIVQERLNLRDFKISEPMFKLDTFRDLKLRSIIDVIHEYPYSIELTSISPVYKGIQSQINMLDTLISSSLITRELDFQNMITAELQALQLEVLKQDLRFSNYARQTTIQKPYVFEINQLTKPELDVVSDLTVFRTLAKTINKPYLMQLANSSKIIEKSINDLCLSDFGTTINLLREINAQANAKNTELVARNSLLCANVKVLSLTNTTNFKLDRNDNMVFKAKKGTISLEKHTIPCYQFNYEEMLRNTTELATIISNILLDTSTKSINSTSLIQLNTFRDLDIKLSLVSIDESKVELTTNSLGIDAQLIISEVDDDNSLDFLRKLKKPISQTKVISYDKNTEIATSHIDFASKEREISTIKIKEVEKTKAPLQKDSTLNLMLYKEDIAILLPITSISTNSINNIFTAYNSIVLSDGLNKNELLKDDLEYYRKLHKDILNMNNHKLLANELGIITPKNTNWMDYINQRDITLDDIEVHRKLGSDIYRSNDASRLLLDNSKYAIISNIREQPLLDMWRRWYFIPSDGPYDQLVLPNDYPYETKPLGSFNKHPFPGKDKALDEVLVDINIMANVIDFCYELWYANCILYSRFTPRQAITHFVNLLYDWLDKYVPDMVYKLPEYYPEDYESYANLESQREDYWRLYRWIRWYAESIFFNKVPSELLNSVDGNPYIKLLLEDLITYFNSHHGIYGVPGTKVFNKVKGVRHKWLNTHNKKEV